MFKVGDYVYRIKGYKNPCTPWDSSNIVKVVDTNNIYETFHGNNFKDQQTWAFNQKDFILIKTSNRLM